MVRGTKGFSPFATFAALRKGYFGKRLSSDVEVSLTHFSPRNQQKSRETKAPTMLESADFCIRSNHQGPGVDAKEVEFDVVELQQMIGHCSL